MKKIFASMVLLAGCFVTAFATDQRVASPNGKLVVTISDEGGKPAYTVSYDGYVVLTPSALGLKTNIGDLTQQLTLKSCDSKTISDHYTVRNIKQQTVDYEAVEAVCHFTQGNKPVMDITFRVSNRDVAYRYRVLPKGETRVCVVESEASAFVMPENTTTFLCPQSSPMHGFARTSPSYETSYDLDQPVGRNGWGEGYTFPCLFKVPAAQPVWVLISETGTDGDYVGCRLLNEGAGNYRIGFPQQGEMNGVGSITPAISLPGETPWRTITVGPLANIVETTVPFDLVQPKYKASQEYIYGKGSWSWIIGMDSSCNFDEQKRYIDFSAAMGYQSVLIDAFWDRQIGYNRIAELARYGKAKGVGLFLWYNSNGSWNSWYQS